MNKNNTCFFTGHRQIPDGLYEKVCDSIRELYTMGYRNFITGGAIGFDTLAAKAVIALREGELEDIRLYIYIPCREQDKYFSKEQKDEYNKILSLADGAQIISEFYHRGCMHQRNRKMADDSSKCIAYCTKSSGGTAFTVDYAKKKGIDIIYI